MTKTVLNFIPIQIKGENNMKKCEKKNISFLISVALSMLTTARVYQDFSPGIFLSKEMVANMNLDVIKVPFCHNSAYIIHMWLKFKRVVITFRLPYIS